MCDKVFDCLRCSHPLFEHVSNENLDDYMPIMWAWRRSIEFREQQDAIVKDPYAVYLCEGLEAHLIKMLQIVCRLSDATPDGHSFAILRSYFSEQSLRRHDPRIHQVVIFNPDFGTAAFRVEALKQCDVIEIFTNKDLMLHHERVLHKQ